MSYAMEVIADSSGKFFGNALRFATEQEAKDYAVDLTCRWTMVRESRVVESADPVNYSFADWKLQAVCGKCGHGEFEHAPNAGPCNAKYPAAGIVVNGHCVCYSFQRVV